MMICHYGSSAQRQLVLKKQNSNSQLDFQFPSLNFTRLNFKTAREVQQQLSRLSLRAYFKSGKTYIKFRKVKKRSVSIIYKCLNKACKAELVFVQENNPWAEIKLVKFNNLHIHSKSKDFEQAKRDDITQFILSLDENIIDDQVATAKWANRFDLSKQKALPIIERALWKNNTEDEILVRLAKKEGIKIRRYRGMEEGKTELIFICNQSMKNMFKQYGETISLSFTDEILCEKSIYGQKYTVGYFFAHDYNLRLLLVGCFVMTRQTEQNFEKLLEFFYECVCENKDQVQTIICDCLPVVNNGLIKFIEKRNYKLEFVNDWLHLIQRQLKPKLKALANGERILATLIKTFNESDPSKYKKIIQQASEMLGAENMDILTQFERNSHRYCFSKMPRRFQSLSMSSSFIKEVITRTKKSHTYRNHTGRLFFHQLYLEDTLLKQSVDRVSSIRIGPIKHFSVQLLFLRQKMERKVMELLVEKYVQSKDLQKITIDLLTYRVRHQETKERGVVVKFNLEYDHWECECNFIYLCGLPCQHIICLVSAMKGSISYYINSRWYHAKGDKVAGKTKPGSHISARTRRRR